MARAKINEVLSAKIKEGAVTEGGESKSNPQTFYDNLPADTTPEQADAIADYLTDYNAAGYHGMGQIAIEALSKDKKLTEVQAHIDMGKFGYTDIAFSREKTTPVPGKKDETVTIKGGGKMNVTFVAGENGGALKLAKRAIREMADEKL